MGHSDSPEERLSEIQQRVAADVAKFGWHVVLVQGDEEGPGFAYSIGLQHSFGHPEIIMFGLRHETMHAAINMIGDGVQAGSRYIAGQVSSEFLDGYDLAFLQVDPRWHAEYFGQALRFYGGPGFAALQCVWPDRAGRFPWQPEYDRRLVERQPVLGEVN